jgi:hypothetical protein
MISAPAVRRTPVVAADSCASEDSANRRRPCSAIPRVKRACSTPAAVDCSAIPTADSAKCRRPDADSSTPRAPPPVSAARRPACSATTASATTAPRAASPARVARAEKRAARD